MLDSYDIQTITEHVRKHEARLFEPYTVGRPDGWTVDQRTKDLVCLSQWMREELTERCGALLLSERDRLQQQWLFNRLSRAEDDLFALAARVMSDTAAGRIDGYRGR